MEWLQTTFLLGVSHISLVVLLTFFEFFSAVLRNRDKIVRKTKIKGENFFFVVDFTKALPW